MAIEEASELTLTFEDRCREVGHGDCPLNYFCQTHGELCCSECAYSGAGRHRGCAVVRAREVEMEFKARLGAGVESLSAEVARMEGDMRRPDGVAKAKEEVAEGVREAFARYREAVEKRKAALLADLEKRYKERVNYAELGGRGEGVPREGAGPLCGAEEGAGCVGAWAPRRDDTEHPRCRARGRAAERALGQAPGGHCARAAHSVCPLKRGSLTTWLQRSHRLGRLPCL